MIIPVAVEKLVQQEFAKIGSRQEALQTISPSLLNIFYYPIVDFFLKTRLFQQPPLFATSIWKWLPKSSSHHLSQPEIDPFVQAEFSS